MNENIDKELIELKAKLWGSFLLFCQTFFPLVSGREFLISNPVCRESHFITLSRELTQVFRLQTNNIVINIPPGHGKSTILCMWVAWCMSRYPNSQFLYISYGFELAAKHTEFIRRIMLTDAYSQLFDIQIRHDMKSKDHFANNHGGSVKAFGSSGPITGQDAGLPGCDHFTGAVIMDDMHKPDEVHSDRMREAVIKNYRETILQRPRAPNVPMIFLGQRLHESDLPSYLLSGEDVRIWKSVILKAIDEAGNALYPEVNPLEQLLAQKEKNSYVFSAQFQQEPVPAGGALFKEKDFAILDQEPNLLFTFITVDTAETTKTYNDASAFSFWGLYEMEYEGQKLGQYALHWINCWEIRVEPKDLESEFKRFYSQCMTHPIKPKIALIEKKSTGVTLLSMLKEMRGLEIREVGRTKASGSKSNRYIEMQPLISSKLISLSFGAKHAKMCVDHMVRITANDAHAHDDICDTVYDAVKAALIDKSLGFVEASKGNFRKDLLKSLAMSEKSRSNIIQRSYQNGA